jgi:4-hydroxy-tetrahydrodipicolinate synthase
MLKGSNVALPTPFRDGKVDEAALRRMVSANVKGGTSALLVLGSTGEAPTMRDEERAVVIRTTVEAAAGRIPVVVGCGTYSTETTIRLTEEAKSAGADFALVITPYYNKPSQEGMYQHFKAVSDAVDVPIVLYNNPGRCAVDLSVETIVRLARLRNIVGLKDSNPDIRRPIMLRRALGKEFLLISGDEPTGLAYMLAGGDSFYNTVGSAIPSRMTRIYRKWDEGDLLGAMELHRQIMPLVFAMYCETNPVPLKYLLSLFGLCLAEVRPPLLALTDAGQRIVRDALTECGISLPTKAGS